MALRRGMTAGTAGVPEGISGTRLFSLIMGVVFLIVGLAGLVPALLTPAEVPLLVETLHGRLLGLFPVNVLHDVVHIAFGIAGIAAYLTLKSATLYARVIAISYAVLAVMGLIPRLDTLFGLVPLYGHDVWLHALIALAAAYFGFRRETASSSN